MLMPLPVLLIAATSLTPGVLNADDANQTPVRWTAPFPDLTKPHAGFPLLEGVEHFDIFRATPQIGAYIPLPVEIDSFNAQPEAPARSGPTAKKAGASGWALNEQMYHFSPVGV